MRVEKIAQLETALDHLSGEEIGNALSELNDSPFILDALYLPGIGKKNRPCGLLQVLCSLENEERACGLIFRHTHVLGIRRQEISRYVLERRGAEVSAGGERLPAKVHMLEGKAYARPEADALAARAKKEGVGMPAFRFGWAQEGEKPE